MSEIALQYILNPPSRPLPNKILLNGKEINEINFKINIAEKNSSIELIRNEILTNCHEMFAETSKIIEINFIDFDTSEVTDMSSMFMNCESLKSLDLSGFDISNVVDMTKLFNKCKNLKTLDLSNFKTSKVKNLEKCSNFVITLKF